MKNRTEKLQGFQRKIAEHMLKSKSEIPHVTTIREIHMDHVLSIRKNYNKENLESKLSLMTFVMMAVINGIKIFPIINASLQNENITYYKNINLGIAITIGDKLIVPVIKNLQEMQLLEISDAYNTTVDKAKNNQLTFRDFADGTFTITNSGALGGEIFTPIINYPQSAILGIGRIKQKPIVAPNNVIKPGAMMYLCLSYDHRIINGSQAVSFLNIVDNNLQEVKIY